MRANTKKKKKKLADEFIKERERYAEIGDDLDIAFVELIPGVEICYNDRHPKPPTPPPKDPTPPPPKEPTPPQAEGAIVTETTTTVVQTIVNADGTTTEVSVVVAVVLGEDGQPIPVAAVGAVEPEVPKGPPPPPPPFEYSKDLPPEGAEVPFVKNYEPPPPEPEPVEVPESEVVAGVDGEVATAAVVPADGTAEGEAAPTDPAAPAADAVPAETSAEVAPATDAPAATEPAATEPVAVTADASADAPTAT